ncbi:MAG: metal-dependent hydrolase [Saprospiraceae bacterium]|nr:metal-dependent hydrolase [Saprospiraceae bacterium]
MDSLTQLVLGAACGEAVLGKKVGNRALLWGAIGGTIPDLDVFANFVTDEITALAFHRSITHSLFFAFLAPLLLGWGVQRLYSSGLYRKQSYKIGMSVFWLLFLIALINGVPAAMGNPFNLKLFGWSFGIVLFLGVLFWRFYWRGTSSEVNASTKGWVLLFFFSIVTHPLLDCCTAYGTQLFRPFLDYRVAWNNISVVDPIYTTPFLISLLVLLFLRRTSNLRQVFNWAAIGLSSAYMMLTFYNKVRVNNIFKESLAAKGIQYERYMTSPTILNNILWNGLAEGDSSYFYAMYSFYDPQKEFLDIQEVPKEHDKLAGHFEDRDIAILTWFTNDYYTLMEDSSGKLMLFDLRYGSMSGHMDSPSDFVFRFDLETDAPEWKAAQNSDGPPIDNVAFRKFWDRVFARTGPWEAPN